MAAIRTKKTLTSLGEYALNKDADAASGKLSVLTERSEENMTEYNRTVQSAYAQEELIRGINDYKRSIAEESGGGAKLSVADEEADAEADETPNVVELSAVRAAAATATQRD